MKTFPRPFAESLMGRVVKRKRRLEIRTGCSVFNARNAFGETKALRLGRLGVEEAFEASTQVSSSR